MPTNNHGFRYNSRKQQGKPKEENQINEAEETNPVLKSFRQYAKELDTKHDRHERILKLSRDITIEAKRIIFLLHTIDSRKNNKSKILDEAQTRLQKVIDINFKAVAKELLGQDPYQFRNAYSPGLQEFIEAYTFMEYIRSTQEDQLEANVDIKKVVMSDWKSLQQKMQYELDIVKPKPDDTTSVVTEAEAEAEEKATPLEEEEKLHFSFFVDPTEYILGLSDLTGELMRRCVNSLGSGETDTCLDTCKVLQEFYTGYISLNVPRCRELSRKIFTMRQSVLKAENVCYNVKVRGGEAAKWGSVFDKLMDDVDEGFY